MQTFNDVHQQFASFFNSETLKPFAYLVSKKLSEGHICLVLDEIEKELDELPTVYKFSAKALNNLASDSLVSTSNEVKKPFVLHDGKLYLQRYFNYETVILNKIDAFIKAEKETIALKFSELESLVGVIKDLFKSEPQIINWQLAAAVNSYINQFSIITGGPGTGKTTTVAKILVLLFNQKPDLKVGLAAPTGKAAARMAESLKNSAKFLNEDLRSKFNHIQPATIHRLLGYIPHSPYFKHNQDNLLTHDVLIIDEASMIDAALFAKLLMAVGTKTKLILLGDKDQLASVEAGSLFGDLCKAQNQLNTFSQTRLNLINSFISEPSSQIPQENIADTQHPLFEHIVELQYSHRFNSEEGIGKFSKAIISNEVVVLNSFIKNKFPDERVKVDTDFQDATFFEFAKNYQQYILETDIKEALQKLNIARVLCAVKEGEQGVYQTNKKIEYYLNQKGLISNDKEFYENRPIIVTSNNYHLGLFNGDIGIIRYDENQVLKAYFEDSEGNLKSVLPGLLTQVETVFAMTIHKSQGSEFEQVLILLPKAEEINLLTRELLYTGVTRAKNKVIVQGTESVILQTALVQVKRASGISTRFLSLS